VRSVPAVGKWGETDSRGVASISLRMTDRVGCGLPFFKSILGGRKAMSRLKRLAVYSAFLLAMGSLGAGQKTVHAQTLDDKALKGMKWRQIGPFRGHFMTFSALSSKVCA